MQPIVAAKKAKDLKSMTSMTILAEAVPYSACQKCVTRCDKFSKDGPKISAGYHNTLWAKFYRGKAQADSVMNW
jgi:hypothetical protein